MIISFFRDRIAIVVVDVVLVVLVVVVVVSVFGWLVFHSFRFAVFLEAQNRNSF